MYFFFLYSTCFLLTFELVVEVAAPLRIAVAGEIAQLQVADGQSYDRRLVQLAGDGGRQRQHFRQLIELKVLLAAPRTGRVAGLFLAQLQYSVVGERDEMAVES